MENQTEEMESTQKSLRSSNHRRGFPCSLGLFQTRHVLILIGFIGFANVYAMRVNLSVAIVAMVNTSMILPNASIDDTCQVPQTNSSSPNEDGEFLWDEATQGLILGSFFWGYILTNPIGGWLADILGGKRVFAFGVFCTSFLTLLCPLASYISPYLLTTLRIFIGLGEGVTFPAMNSMISKWIPPLERSQAVSIVFSGAQIGIIIAYPLCGLLCHSTFLGGWPSTFYLFGTLGLLWCIAWMALVSDSPLTHPRICDEEKTFILSSLGGHHIIPQRLPIPFKEIATSLPVWATLVAHVSQNWGYYFLLTELPTYLKNVLHFNIKEGGFISALPYLVMWCVSIGTGFLADFLRCRNHLSTVATRRIFNTIAFFGPMICLVSVGYSGCDTKLTLALLTVGVGLNGSLFSGAMNSHLDIASNYAGTLLGITNCAATVPGFLAPIVVGRLISGHETLAQWRLAFWIAGIVYFVGNIFYVVFVSGEEQPWNKMYTRDYQNENETPENQYLLNPDESENGSAS